MNYKERLKSNFKENSMLYKFYSWLQKDKKYQDAKVASDEKCEWCGNGFFKIHRDHLCSQKCRIKLIEMKGGKKNDESN